MNREQADRVYTKLRDLSGGDYREYVDAVEQIFIEEGYTLLPKGDGEGLIANSELEYRWRKGLSREGDYHDAAKEIAKAQKRLDDIKWMRQLEIELEVNDEKHQKEIGEILSKFQRSRALDGSMWWMVLPEKDFKQLKAKHLGGK